MQPFDLVAVVMLLAAAICFVLGASALGRSEDLVAFYWLVVGVVTVRASVQIAKSGVRSSGGRA